MVLHAINSTPWSKEELLRRFPLLLTGAEGEGEGDGAGTQSPSGDGPDATTTPPAGDKTPPETFTREYVESLRAENASHRTKNKELESENQRFKDAETERQKAEMTDRERAEAERDEERSKRETAEKALLDERKRNAVISEAAKLKFRDPQDALAYIDMESIQMTNEGQPHKTSIEAAVKKIAEEKKYLIEGPGSADGGTYGATPANDADRKKEIQNDIIARGGVPVPM